MFSRLFCLCLIVMTLGGCSMFVGGLVGAAITPFVQPQVDRALNAIGAPWVDPGGTEPVHNYDSGKS